jgi:hypothetical protein
MKTNKFCWALLIFTFFLSGCEDSILNQQPVSFLAPENFYLTSKDAVASVNAAYQTLDVLYSAETSTSLDLMTDDIVNRTGINAFQYIELANHSFTPTTSTMLSIWSTSYQCIKNCNAAIDYVPGIKMDTVLRNRVIGEARFIRALVYFNLAREFGDVPIVKHIPDNLGNLEISRDELSDVYALVEEDLAFAIKTLPVSYANSEKGRATLGAAMSLLAKVHLTLGEFPEAILLLKNVIDSKTYQLMPNFADLFKVANENGMESVFEIQFADDGTTGAAGNSLINIILPRNSEIGTGPAFATFLPRQNLTDSYDKVKDKRFAASFFNSWYNPATLKTIVFKDNCFHFRKYFDESSVSNITRKTFGDNPNNMYVLRYADVLLMYAESENEVNGPTPIAYDAIKLVRSRAGLDVLPAGLSKDAFRNAVYSERRWEFALEGQRWFDLKRTGKLLDVIRVVIKPDIPESHLLFPIPQGDRDRNPNLSQNQGY